MRSSQEFQCEKHPNYYDPDHKLIILDGQNTPILTSFKGLLDLLKDVLNKRKETSA